MALDVAVSAEPGHPDRSSAPAAIASIRRAVADVMAGAAAAVVTNPVAKNVLYDSGFAEPGHTEFLATLVQEATGKSLRPVMMLWSPELAVVPVTIHLPLREIFAHLSTELMVETGRIVARDLAKRFRIPRPRLAIAGLNPHAGENGALGEEDRTIVAPAVAQLIADGIDARGPLPADSMFHERARATYDAALCMYHDQALIPIKTLAFDHAVNVTLGLPFVRTSPDHGTAFDIAGTGAADATSLVAALRLAAAAGQGADSRRCSPRRDRRAGRPAAVARGHSPPRPRRQKIARTEFSVRPQSGRAHRARGGRPRRRDGARGRPRAGRPDARAAGARRRARDRGRARRARDRRAAGDCRALSRPSRHRRGGRARASIRARTSSAARCASSPICPTTSPRRCWSPGSRIEPWPPWYDAAVLMFQREVAERIVAAPGSKSYGRLSRAGAMALRGAHHVRGPSVGLRAAAEGHLRARAFCAAGGAARLRPQRSSRAVTKAAFGQRRKMLRQSLRALGADVSALLATADLAPTARAEDISVAGFVALARALAARRGLGHDAGPDTVGGRDHHDQDAPPVARRLRPAAVRNRR